MAGSSPLRRARSTSRPLAAFSRSRRSWIRRAAWRRAAVLRGAARRRDARRRGPRRPADERHVRRQVAVELLGDAVGAARCGGGGHRAVAGAALMAAMLRARSVNSSHASLSDSGRAQALGEAVDLRRPLEPGGERGLRQPRQQAFDQPFARPPHPVLPCRHRERPARLHLRLHPDQRAQFLGDRPQHQRDRLAFGFESGHRLAHARGVAAEHRERQLEDVVARDVQHAVGDLRQRQLARRMEQPELRDLLVGREEVAFDALGDELQRLGSGPLLLPREPLADPLRQPRAVDRVDLDQHARAFQRGHPARLLAAAVELRQARRSSAGPRRPARRAPRGRRRRRCPACRPAA